MKRLDSELLTTLSLCHSAEDRKHSLVIAFLQASMIGKRHCAYIFFHNDDVRYLKEVSWLRGTRAALVQMGSIPALAEWKLYLSFARVDSCVAGGYIAVCEQELKHRVYLLLERFPHACYFPQHVLRKALGAVFVLSRTVCRVVHICIPLIFRGMSNAS